MGEFNTKKKIAPKSQYCEDIESFGKMVKNRSADFLVKFKNQKFSESKFMEFFMSKWLKPMFLDTYYLFQPSDIKFQLKFCVKTSRNCKFAWKWPKILIFWKFNFLFKNALFGKILVIYSNLPMYIDNWQHFLTTHCTMGFTKAVKK